jgi:putative PIN family toxin of toxin-antitoxin system
MNEKFEVYFTNEILLEYEEVLIQKYGSEIGSNFINAIQKLPNANNIVTYYNFNLIQADPDDNKFVDCAIAANVDWLITNDRHFNVLKDINFPVVNIIRLEDFEQQFAEFLK